jgi:hypothetical protein
VISLSDDDMFSLPLPGTSNPLHVHWGMSAPQ